MSSPRGNPSDIIRLPTQQNGKRHLVSHPPHPAYPAHQPISTPATAPYISSHGSDRSPVPLPKVGQTRCYWALLTSDLQFIYLDPVLTFHLEEQAELLVGKSLLSFVHPDELASAKVDLSNALESKVLHGTVTRVRFSRLSRVRRQLGYDGPGPAWSDAQKIAVDENYMAVDIVINWAADELVLCFIHASVDLTPNDNDERHKTDWTNWCGTPTMTSPQIADLYGRLLVCIPHGNMNRVFQILAYEQGRPLLLSWPPNRDDQVPTSFDFAKLAEHAQIESVINDAKTSCTRRYKALQSMPTLGGEVESIYIPHGSIIFACHKVNTSSRGPISSGAPMQQLAYNSNTYSSQQNPQYYEQQGAPYALPPLSSPTSYGNNYMNHQPSPIQVYTPQRWSQGGEQQPGYSQWSLPSPTHPVSALPPPPNQHQWQAPTTSPYAETGNNGQQTFNRPVSPSYSYTPAVGPPAPSPTADVVPPPRRRVSPGSSRDHLTAGGRSGSNRPMGVHRCSSCKATQSPEWRKGPSGKKELCNACGLRYARSRAKKEGGGSQAQRRRKDKGGVTKRESATPPIASPSSYSAIRRSYGDSSFSTSSAGSASGSDIYPHSGHHVLETLTPSPSPPASSMNFVHYSPGGDARQPYSSNTTTFYSMPSPLSNPPVIPPQEQQPQVTQLPPLDQISSYAPRLSPMLPSASSIHSPLATSSLPSTASFERDRDRDRDFKPVPLTTEPRHSRRSILSQH